ncbi:MAG: hypothetical protein R2865_11105 [Deinococcales bacterium]
MSISKKQFDALDVIIWTLQAKNIQELLHKRQLSYLKGSSAIVLVSDDLKTDLKTEQLIDIKTWLTVGEKSLGQIPWVFIHFASYQEDLMKKNSKALDYQSLRLSGWDVKTLMVAGGVGEGLEQNLTHLAQSLSQNPVINLPSPS